MDQSLRRLGRTYPRLPAARFTGCEDKLFTLDSIQVVRLSLIAGSNWGIITAVPRHANCFYAATHLHKRGDRFFFTLFMAT
ncbi:hypothetical protein D3C76_1522110 [compost metagenome]